MFNSSRLTLARMRRGLTAKALAECVGISAVQISRLEKGVTLEPGPETLSKIAECLAFPKDFFCGDDVELLNMESASFRSLSTRTARERNAALAAGTIAYLLSDWVSSRFNLPCSDLIDLGYESDYEAAARSVRQQWGLGERPIKNILKLLESKGVRMFSLSENTKNIDAFSTWRNDIPYIFLNTFKSAEHSRFDAAHELGHLVLHRHGGPKGREAEIEANSFAAAFLMPRDDVLSMVPFVTGMNQLLREKKRWGVSLAALAHRVHKLNLISDWQYRRMCIQINRHGFNTNEPDPMQRETSVIWHQVFEALWNERISKSTIAKSLKLPDDEIENLVFGLTRTPERPNVLMGGKAQLRVIN